MGQFIRPSAPATYAVDPAGPVTNGDLLMFAAGKALRMSADTDYASFIGVAEGQIPLASNVDNAQGLEKNILVREDDVFGFNTTNSESYTHGVALKMGTDAQTVMLDGGASRVIGYVFLPDGTTVTGAAGVKVPVRLKINYPTAKLG
jgi:hypothetical protein